MMSGAQHREAPVLFETETKQVQDSRIKRRISFRNDPNEDALHLHLWSTANEKMTVIDLGNNFNVLESISYSPHRLLSKVG